MTKHLRSILFWGTLWGLFESTVGAAIHALGWHIGFLVWSPAAAYFLWRCERETGSRSAMMLTACVTAAIKLTNLILPMRLDYVVNPAVSILLEGAAFAAALSLKNVFGRLALYSIGWRGMYLLYLLLVPTAWQEISALGSWDALVQFMLIENAAALAVMLAGAWLGRRMPQLCSFKKFSALRTHPAVLASFCLLSMAIQLWL